jgi:hypothetical protein
MADPGAGRLAVATPAHAQNDQGKVIGDSQKQLAAALAKIKELEPKPKPPD